MLFKKSLFVMFVGFLWVNSTFALNPSRTYKHLPEKFNLTYESFKVQTNDGSAELNIWYFPAPVKTTNLILISHSGEGNMGDYLRRVSAFINFGYNVVTYDYRGYGESSEFEIDNNMFIYPHFQDDMGTMIDFCRQKFTQNFHLYGWGIGAGLALGVGYNRTETLSIIADTPFLSMEDLENRFTDWDEPMEVPFAGYEKRFEPIYAFDNEPGKNLKKIKLIVGSNDALFAKADMAQLQAKQKSIVAKEIYLVENPDRKDNFAVDKDRYLAVIKEFLGS